MRETIDVIRQAFAGEKSTTAAAKSRFLAQAATAVRCGCRFRPIPTSPSTSRRCRPRCWNSPARRRTAGWEPASSLKAPLRTSQHLDAGLAASGRTREDLDVCQGAEVAILPRRRRGRGPRRNAQEGTRFQPRRHGVGRRQLLQQRLQPSRLGDVAAEIRDRWQAGDRDGASALVTDEMVLATTLIGTEAMVRERLRVWRDAGVDTVRLYPAGATTDQKLDTLAHAIELVRTLE